MKFLPGESLIIAILTAILSFGNNSIAQVPQKTVISGVVTDKLTGEPIPYASVILKGTTVGDLTDNLGKYRIETKVSATEISFSFIGYETVTAVIKQGVEQTINASLALSSITLDEVVVKPGREKYRNRNNPAVELIQKVIEMKDSNRVESYDYLSYRKYEKVQFAVSNINENFKNSSLFSKFNFVFDNLDTTRRIGNMILPVFIKETISDYYYRKQPEATKEIILGEKTINLEEYLNNKGAANYLNYLYQNINIYDNEILFLTNKFLSPIAGSAPAFYRYYLIDTLPVRDIKCIRLFFEPRNKSDFLFHGNLYITMDSTYAVRKIDMGINKDINIDWVQDISITQDFERSNGNAWLLSKDETSIDFGIVKNTLGLYGQRTLSYRDYKLNEPVADNLFRGPEKIDRIDPSSEQPEFWEANRSVPLTKTEKAVYSTIDSLRQVPAFRIRMDIAMMITAGILKVGKVEIEPISSFYSYNTVEGSRFRFGGRTSTEFSKKTTFDGYIAYGTRDNEFKYNAGVTYSLTSRTIYQFPVRSIRFSYQKDTRIPGQELQFTQADNILLSFKRGVNDKLTMNNTFRFEYLHEYDNHFSWQTGYSYNHQLPYGSMQYVSGEPGSVDNNIKSIDVSEVFLNLRYAPNESFYQGKLYRVPFPTRNPVIQLKIAGGAKFIQNDYDYLRLQLNFSRRYYLSILGYTDISLEAGTLFGKVPFPLLFIHRANQTYAYQKASYNLMNYLEFVSDRYGSVNIDHSFNGFILNKVPLIKKLKLREIVTCKLLYGRLADMNNPDYSNDLFRFPTDENGVPLTYTLSNQPYLEAGVGLSNILRIFRVDFIRRFTYLGNPNVDDTGFRIQFRLDI